MLKSGLRQVIQEEELLRAQQASSAHVAQRNHREAAADRSPAPEGQEDLSLGVDLSGNSECHDSQMVLLTCELRQWAPGSCGRPPILGVGLTCDAGAVPENGALAARSPAFIEWCTQQMQELGGSLSLVEVLLSLASGGEVAELCTQVLGNSPKVEPQH
eukprot:scaffold225994_cov42-Prasinocladus_malaysianus.AAC.1